VRVVAAVVMERETETVKVTATGRRPASATPREELA
jgi:hypothetical protein